MQTPDSQGQPFPAQPRFPLARLRADQELLKLHATRLPFNPFPALRQMGVNVLTYAEFARACGLTIDVVTAFAGTEEGCLMMHHGRRCLLYNDAFTDCWEHIRWTVAHELGHDLLGHLRDHTTGEIAAASEEAYKILESEADACAAELLAPKCILYALGARDVEDIRRRCQISKQAAGKAAHFFTCVHGSYRLNAVEAQLCTRFHDFLHSGAA